ncbi:MAG TPA: hypothetical protein PLJ88_05230, partial [Agitococcus sp.]|nr:hypothetical protein [Agitococcus sp.]
LQYKYYLSKCPALLDHYTEGIAIAAMGMHKAGLSVELIAKSLSLAESVVLALLKEDEKSCLQ